MSESTKCPQCGSELPANFPPGFCPACLLRQGMSPSTLTGAAGEASGASGSGPRRSWTPPTPAELAPKFPQLEIVELLGQGGMGAVYKVRQRDLDRWAALKILPGDVANDPNFAERFQREARALAQLSHQHIVTVYEFGQRDGVYFLLMEYVDGVTLRQASRAGQVTNKDALGIVTQICDALQFAHEEGIVHRDIKPENILIDKRGRVKIADFGLAKLLGKQSSFPTLTGTHQIMGTPVYMAPEQMEGSRNIDHRADMFSLGVVFYELLTGELPLGRFAPPSQKYSLDVRLDEVVLRTLEKEPDRRYQQASEVKLDVETIRSQPVAAKPSKSAKPRQPWTLARVALLALIVLMGSFAGLVGCVVIGSWLTYASHQRPSENQREGTKVEASAQWTDSDLDAAKKLYVADLRRQRQEQEQPQQLEPSSRDPLEANAVVQFTADGVKLHPHAFGTDELTADQRVTLEKILTDIHREYLKVEVRHTNRETLEDGTQVINIEPFGHDFSVLEDAFWTAIDSQFPVTQQKLLRQRLPLLSDTHTDFPQVSADLLETVSGGGVGGMSAGIPSIGGNTMLGDAPPGIQSYAVRNLRYQQLLGWKALPLRISINRRGKWYRWKIGPQSDTFSDSGETPELPSALRRFWHEPASPKVGGHGQDAHADPLDLQPSETAEDESREYVLWTNDGVRLSDRIAIAAALPGDQLSQVNQTLSEMHRKYVEVEAKFTEVVLTLEGHQRFTIQTFPKEQTELENELWTKLDAIVTDEKQRTTLRGNLPLFNGDGGLAGLASKRPSAHPELLGWTPKSYPVVVDVWRKGTWFHWTIKTGRVSTGETDGARLPGELARFWRESGPVPNPAGSLAQQLLALDALRAAGQTPWDEVEKRANELLAKYTAPADQGRIHWMAAHVYGQSDIRGHAADVMRHAQEALKYERDPIQRGWLFMYLGNAAEVIDSEPKNFVQRRAQAAIWYLKGYKELLPFNLPDKAPELPVVGKISDGFQIGVEDLEQAAAEVQHAAQLKARKDAEFTRELVSRRDIYIGRLQDLYGRMHDLYDKEGSAHSELRRMAFLFLFDQTVIDQLVERVALPKSISGEKPPE